MLSHTLPPGHCTTLNDMHTSEPCSKEKIKVSASHKDATLVSSKETLTIELELEIDPIDPVTDATYDSFFVVVQFFMYRPMFTPLLCSAQPPPRLRFQWPLTKCTPSILDWYLRQAQFMVHQVEVNAVGHRKVHTFHVPTVPSIWMAVSSTMKLKCRWLRPWYLVHILASLPFQVDVLQHRYQATQGSLTLTLSNDSPSTMKFLESPQFTFLFSPPYPLSSSSSSYVSHPLRVPNTLCVAGPNLLLHSSFTYPLPSPLQGEIQISLEL
ncbi:hypothetical protein HMI54_014281 [Coelomomyces lativittatus]|nr:hypothetical protein HMI55_002427 [Coelomomyces lativittatus]KAJ1511937.1 hypothetical protein HMI56_004733 [Coelomomyces lativittatus]KAJ1514313.1 hypothetical protein HMI54_014281 [Coelomomyces lativittatus]